MGRAVESDDDVEVIVQWRRIVGNQRDRHRGVAGAVGAHRPDRQVDASAPPSCPDHEQFRRLCCGDEAGPGTLFDDHAMLLQERCVRLQERLQPMHGVDSIWLGRSDPTRRRRTRTDRSRTSSRARSRRVDRRGRVPIATPPLNHRIRRHPRPRSVSVRQPYLHPARLSRRRSGNFVPISAPPVAAWFPHVVVVARWATVRSLIVGHAFLESCDVE